MQSKIHDGFSRFLGCRDTVSTYLGRHRGRSLRYTVLYFYRTDIGIFIKIKINVKSVFAYAGTGRVHVQHIFYTINFLFDRLGNRFLNNLGTRTHIVR